MVSIKWLSLLIFYGITSGKQQHLTHFKLNTPLPFAATSKIIQLSYKRTTLSSKIRHQERCGFADLPLPATAAPVFLFSRLLKKLASMPSVAWPAGPPLPTSCTKTHNACLSPSLANILHKNTNDTCLPKSPAPVTQTFTAQPLSFSTPIFINGLDGLWNITVALEEKTTPTEITKSMPTYKHTKLLTNWTRSYWGMIILSDKTETTLSGGHQKQHEWVCSIRTTSTSVHQS